MSREVVVVGSGASAVHFAESALDNGWRVTMVDVGREAPRSVEPATSFKELIETYDGATEYFLGERFQGVTLPGPSGEYYGFAPHREYIFEGIDQHAMDSRGFDALVSFAQGGLGQAWTGGCFPFNEGELVDFPWGFDAIKPYYDLVAERIGVMGAEDDLSKFMPVHAHLGAPLELDQHAAKLVAGYGKHKRFFNEQLGCWLGRSRAAVITEPREGRLGCTKLGRCLWGCPRGALYTPSMTLEKLRARDGFRYVAGAYVSHFQFEGRQVKGITVQSTRGGGVEHVPVERLALAAGTLATTKIVLDSLFHAGQEPWALDGLMDNRQVLMPFLNLGMLGKQYDPNTYQYHQLCFGVDGTVAGSSPKEYLHGIVTTLKTALMHPIAQNIPLDLRTAIHVFRNMHAALGLVNINWHDTRRRENTVTLGPGTDGRTLLNVRYVPSADEPERMQRGKALMKRALGKLGCIVPPGMVHMRPMGASVHYAGTIPMSKTAESRTTAADGKSHDFDNLWLVDGSTFPFLPAKNITFSLMANAARIAATSFGRA